MNKVYFDTLGCFKNAEDSERAAGLLVSSGFGLSESPDDADVIIVNTCGFIDDAKRESIDRVLELAEYKSRGAKLIVSGCLSQRYPDELFAEIPEADAIIGVNEYGRLPEIVAKLLELYDSDGPASERRILRTDGEPGMLIGPRKRLITGASAYLKVAEGCDNRCAYCAIPMIRGPYRSVPIEILADEAESLASSGARELILIAQDVSAYGSDIYGRYALPELLGKLASISASAAVAAGDDCGDSSAYGRGTWWVRLMYCYEERITDELIEAVAAYDNVCNYIDIPLQHISDSVLGRMGRRSTRRSIERTLSKLRSAVPDIAVRTTFMTGFPGESEDDFAELVSFAAEQRFERLGVFAFSPEDGTRAAEMPDRIPRETAEERRDVLMQRQLDISLEKNRRFIGRTLNVLVEEPDEDGCYIGRTEYDAPEIDGSVIFSSAEPLTVGTFTNVHITDAMDYDLVGEMIYGSTRTAT